MIKLLVTGDRDWKDKDKDVIHNVLANYDNQYSKESLILVHGNARGVDRLAAEYALKAGWKEIKSYPAKWDELGRQAGPIRNSMMLRENPDISIVHAFHPFLRYSKGTRDMMKKAFAKKIITVNFTDDEGNTIWHLEEDVFKGMIGE